MLYKTLLLRNNCCCTTLRQLYCSKIHYASFGEASLNNNRRTLHASSVSWCTSYSAWVSRDHQQAPSPKLHRHREWRRSFGTKVIKNLNHQNLIRYCMLAQPWQCWTGQWLHLESLQKVVTKFVFVIEPPFTANNTTNRCLSCRGIEIGARQACNMQTNTHTHSAKGFSLNRAHGIILKEENHTLFKQ